MLRDAAQLRPTDVEFECGDHTLTLIWPGVSARSPHSLVQQRLARAGWRLFFSGGEQRTSKKCGLHGSASRRFGGWRLAARRFAKKRPKQEYLPFFYSSTSEYIVFTTFSVALRWLRELPSLWCSGQVRGRAIRRTRRGGWTEEHCRACAASLRTRTDPCQPETRMSNGSSDAAACHASVAQYGSAARSSF